jgi:hypothetical protein
MHESWVHEAPLELAEAAGRWCKNYVRESELFKLFRSTYSDVKIVLP